MIFLPLFLLAFLAACQPLPRYQDREVQLARGECVTLSEGVEVCHSDKPAPPEPKTKTFKELTAR